MPIYEYRCTLCGHELEALQKLSDPPLADCPACNAGSLTKLVSAASFQLKGSGWYATDFKGGSKPAESGADPKPAPPAGESKSNPPAGEGKSDPPGAPACGAGGCSACS